MRTLVTTIALTLAAFGSQAATLYTGDKIDGVPVISQLDIKDLPAGKLHRFLFRGASNGIGQYFYLPVQVAKGSKPGSRLVLNSGNHGDEVNGIRAVQNIMASLNPEQLSGSVLAVTGSNPDAINRISREWATYNDGLSTSNFNRLFPGKENGTAPEQQAWLMWNKLWQGNADYVLDYHTQSSGTSFPFFIYADYRQPRIQQLAELFPADQIKKDPGEKGSTETTFVEANIPALTLELGTPRSLDADMIARAEEGTHNVMITLKMLEGKLGRTASSVNTYIGNDMVTIRAEQGGYADIFVKLGDKVEKGQLLAQQRNIFGDIIKKYNAPTAGKVLSVGTDAVREPRATLVRLLLQNPDPKCQLGC
ncbi:succinylglutamate desuccinylase/aspartoacylase family protein [Neisseriaceae bacterium TC5R-5]|nr:succinylglutamate desuccinylase/aspartoacylase family protein [Neisseriaceae bacterium TC5R-5]